jgi:hypothetical protein
MLTPCIFVILNKVTDQLMHTKTTFNVALLLLKLLKLYPYTCFDPRIIVRGFFAENYSHFKHMILNSLTAH